MTLMVVVLIMATASSYAFDVIEFGPKETRISGMIKYSVIGKYKASFDAFKGKISVDELSHDVRSVYLEIQVSSIDSNCRWCDGIVRSRQLLYTEKYPQIIFKSNEIIREGADYRVQGTLQMHGVTKSMTFPFKVNIVEERHKNFLDLNGTWVINRKDFGVIWSALFDRGGILVGDNITVDWGIRRCM